MADFTVLFSTSGAYLAVYLAVFLYSVYKVSSDETANKSFIGALKLQFKQKLAVYFAITVHVFDQASDYEACVAYYRKWQRGGEDEVNVQWWFIICVSILVIHRIVSTAITWQKTRDWKATLLQLTDLSMAKTVLSDVSEDGELEIDHLSAELAGYDAILESFPQLVLSLVFLLRTNEASTSIIIQAGFSIYNLAMRVCSQDVYVFPKEFAKPRTGCGCPCVNTLYLSRVFLFRVPEVAQRVAVLSLCWALLGGQWLALIIPLDLTACKLASYQLDQRDRNDSNNIGGTNDESGSKDEYYYLEMDWKEPEFYSYLLYFKPSIDHYYVWHYGRPLLSLLYVGVSVMVASQFRNNRMKIVRSDFGFILLMVVILCSITPLIFRCMIEKKTAEDGTNYNLRRLLSAKPVIPDKDREQLETTDVEKQ